MATYLQEANLWIKDAKKLVHRYRQTNIIDTEAIRALIIRYQETIFLNKEYLERSIITDSIFDQCHTYDILADEAEELHRLIKRIAKGGH